MIFYAKILILEELNLLSMEWWCIFIILEEIFIIHKNIKPSFIDVWFFRKISISRFHHYKKHLSVARIKNKIHFSNALACLLWQCITIFCQMKSSYLTCLVPFFLKSPIWLIWLLWISWISDSTVFFFKYWKYMGDFKINGTRHVRYELFIWQKIVMHCHSRHARALEKWILILIFASERCIL